MFGVVEDKSGINVQFFSRDYQGGRQRNYIEITEEQKIQMRECKFTVKRYGFTSESI